MDKRDNLGNRTLKVGNIPVPVIDLFAGPGGLGEGFSSARSEQGNPLFKILLSIEKDRYAHRTLELRAFFRGFDERVPEEYYSYLRGEITREKLFEGYPVQSEAASSQAWLAELGSELFPPEVVDQRIHNSLEGAKNWILIGGPPCQAYSVIGRARMRGDDPSKFERDPRHFLYREYLRILAVHRPPVFIMENVQGILSARINGDRIFLDILSDLHEPHKCLPIAMLARKKFGPRFRYRLYSLRKLSSDRSSDPSSFVIRMKHYGIPQDRNRVIILGVREDVDIRPGFLRKSDRMIPMKSVIEELPRLRSRLSKEIDSGRIWSRVLKEIAECSWINDGHIDADLRLKIVAASRRVRGFLTTGGTYVHCNAEPKYMPEWFSDERLGGVCNHSSRSHIRADIQRYFFASCFALAHKHSPLLKDFPHALLPEHKNAPEAAKNRNALFPDRFRVQIRNFPATTITSHISKDGHYFIHPDPCQCRSLTVREAARIQTFPDNYFFEGPQTSQYQQVGNAVPPLLARSIAEIVHKILARRIEEPLQLELTLQHHV